MASASPSAGAGRTEYPLRPARSSQAGPRHVVGPLTLLAAGLLLLLNNLHVVPWTVWRELWPYWPLLLVLLGVEALIAGRVAWGTLVLLVLLLPVVGLAIFAGSLPAHWRETTRSAAGPAVSVLSQPLGGATSAGVEVEYGGGALLIGPLADDLAATTLIDGRTYGHQGVRFNTRSTEQGGRRTVAISPDEAGGSFSPGRLELRLSPGVPTDLSIESGLTEMTLDLERLRIPKLDIATGASSTRVVLPARGQTAATIEGGAASLEVTIPANVAARIVVEGGPNRFEIDQDRFPRQGAEYRSPDFDTSPDRVTLRIAVGASRVAVQ